MILRTNTKELKKFYGPLKIIDIEEAFPNKQTNPKQTVKSWSPCCIHEFKEQENNSDLKDCIKCGKTFSKTHIVLIPFNKYHKKIFDEQEEDKEEKKEKEKKIKENG